MSHLIGINVSATDTALTDGTTFQPGARTEDHLGNTYVYVKASAAFTAGDCVAVKAGGTSGTPITLTIAKTAVRTVGFAQVGVALDSYAWIQVSGQVPLVRVAIDCEPKVALYPTSSAGVLDDATVSVMIQGVCINTSATAAGTFAGQAAFPAVSRGANLNQI